MAEQDELLREIRGMLRDHGQQLERIEHDHGKRLLELRTTQLAHDATLRDHGRQLCDHGQQLERIKARVDAVDDRVSEVQRELRDLAGTHTDEHPAA